MTIITLEKKEKKVKVKMKTRNKKKEQRSKINIIYPLKTLSVELGNGIHWLASKTMKMGTSFIIRLALATLINIPISLRLSNAQGVGGYTNPYSGAQPWSTEPIPQYIGT
jgi:hypothetical protein